MIKWDDPETVMGGKKNNKRREGEIKHLPIYPFPDTINTRWVSNRKMNLK